MNPLRISTITSCSFGERIHLCSPTVYRPLIRALETTLVDCFTFGLRLNRHRIDPVKHYEWYIDFVKEHQHENDLVFVAPDWEWIGNTRNLEERWLSEITHAACMIVPKTELFDRVSKDQVVGHALQRGQTLAHPEWTHSFSQFYCNQLSGPTKLWTYDTLNKGA